MSTFKHRTTILSRLPVCYQKFFKEWKYGAQTPVHFKPEEGKWKRNPETGEVKIVQNKPLPLTYPKEFDQGLWGGEAIVRGFLKRHQLRRRVPHFWFPTLQKSVLYSEILDKYLEVVVTPRTLRLVDQHYGFDSYILETPPQDLKSNLGIKLKRTLLLALAKKDFLPNNPSKKEELLKKYQKHILPEEEAEWYGLTLPEALEKLGKAEKVVVERKPLKLKFREEFIEQLKEKQLEESSAGSKSPSTSSSWNLNPFKFNKTV
nr:EOG090X0GHI [Ceriodaphnia reticulata]